MKRTTFPRDSSQSLHGSATISPALCLPGAPADVRGCRRRQPLSSREHPMNRRDFLRDVGAGVVVAHIGSGLGADLGFSTAFAQQGANRLTFGNLDPLVNVMQETTAANLLPQ